MTAEELHLAASRYATRRRDAYAARMESGDAPHMTVAELNGRWLNHYEGYREGYWVATGSQFSTDPAKEARLMAVNAELVEALKGLADEFVKTFPVYYASEPWRHETNAPLRKARAALAKAEASNGS